MNSHDKMDTVKPHELGKNDGELALKLVKSGPSHRKFLRQIMFWGDVSGSLKFMDQLSTYEFCVLNSTSQMHKLGSRLLDKADFTYIDEDMLKMVNEKIRRYQVNKTMKIWREMIDSIPQSFIYTRTLMTSYETFLCMYRNRKDHKMFEWRAFCTAGREKLPFMNTILEEV